MAQKRERPTVELIDETEFQRKLQNIERLASDYVAKPKS